MLPSPRPRNPHIPTVERLKKLMYWSLFEDLFDYGNGVTRRILPPEKDPDNPLLEPEMPWENNCAYPSVFIDPESGRWRMWYGSGTGDVCTAESDDGVHWERPEVGQVEFEGSTRNNIVVPKPADKATDGPCVFYDPKGKPDERYKLAIAHNGQCRDDSGMALYGSPDGTRWHLIKQPIITIHLDCQCTMFRDPVSGLLLSFHRPAFIVRTVTQSQSEDGLDWKGHNHWLFADAIDRQMGLEHYSLPVFPVDGHLLGFTKIYANVWWDKTCWVEVVASRDVPSYNRGEVWWRSLDRTPFIANEREDQWDSFRLAPGHGLVWDEAKDGHWLYYHCVNALHTKGKKAAGVHGRIGRAFIRYRRFHEWYADDAESILRTVPLCWEGETLTVDHRCVSDAAIRASIVLPDGTTPEGFAAEDSTPLSGEDHHGEIAFTGGTLECFRDTGAQIQFHMTHGAHLYAFGVL